MSITKPKSTSSLRYAAMQGSRAESSVSKVIPQRPKSTTILRRVTYSLLSNTQNALHISIYSR